MAKYKDNVQAKFRPLSESTSTQIANDIQLLVDRLARDLQEGKERGLRYLNDMKFAMDQNTGDIQSQMGAYLRKLRKRLHSDTEEIRKWVAWNSSAILTNVSNQREGNSTSSCFFSTVATYMGELQSRATQNMDAAREQVQPYVHDTIDNAGEKMTQVSTALRNQAEDLGRQLESQAEVLRSNLEATGQEMRTFIEGVMESLNAELPSIASQVREKLEDIVDKVQKTASA